MTILVTGGAGFIGSNFVRTWLAEQDETIVTLDVLTYASNMQNLAEFENHPGHVFVRGDICERALLDALLLKHQPRAILNFAAESHVDRSIDGPAAFVRTNVQGVFELLEASRAYWHALDPVSQKAFRFLHVSTDEVFGSLAPTAAAFTEQHPYQPNSPYSASKAASDHLVRAWHHTYGLPVLTSNCSNNYGPYQFPEKLIPLVILNALAGKALPIYGDGRQVRDWLYVGDHCRALQIILRDGVPGQTYNVGGGNEHSNLDVVHTICDLLDAKRARADGQSYRSQIQFVQDRPGHDRRYAIDARKLIAELGWQVEHSFETGLSDTVDWYLQNADWAESVVSGEYRSWMARHYGACDV